MATNALVGKTVVALWLAEDRQALKFDLAGGESVIARADGDCCSHSWVEEIQGVEQLVGATVTAVEDVAGVQDTINDSPEHDCLQFYGCKIVTDRGFALIDYRNSSNGYYGGNLSWVDDYFYGGVHGQNQSKEVWKLVVAQP